MSFDREDIVKVVLAAAEDLNATQSEQDRFEPAETTLIIGDGGSLSSLAVVMLIVGVEERLSDALARPISLFDESLIADPQGPFRTVGSFVNHIQAVVRDTAS